MRVFNSNLRGMDVFCPEIDYEKTSTHVEFTQCMLKRAKSGEAKKDVYIRRELNTGRRKGKKEMEKKVRKTSPTKLPKTLTLTPASIIPDRPHSSTQIIYT